MAEKKKEAERPSYSPMIPIPNWVWRIVGLSSIVIGYFYMYPVDTSGWFQWSKSGSGVSTPLPSENPRPTVSENPRPTNPYLPAKDRKEIRVQVDPVEWSGWVKIPPNCWWEVNRPGCWEEYWFIDDRKVKSGIGETINVGSIPNNTFKIRGTKGEVVITYEPK